jgi:uncharacterized membrane protein YeaQ/YmgE (transglycosylase-associated protein family)
MELLSVILSWALCGLIVGLIARLLVPTSHAIGWVRTIVVGIVGALVGGLICRALYGAPGEPFSFSAASWPGWIFSILGAVLVLLLYTWWKRRSSWSKWW